METPPLMPPVKVLLLSRYDRMAPSSRLRSYQYIPYLKSRGIEVDDQPLSTRRYLKNFYAGRPMERGDVIRSYLRRLARVLSTRTYDLLWIEHELFPWMPAFWEEWLCKIGIPYMVDYDDAVFHRYDRHPSRMIRRLFGRKIDRVMRHSGLVIAGNRYLADRAIMAGAPRVEILPTVIDIKRYRPAAPDRDKAVLTVGWIGTPTTAGYVAVADPALSDFCSTGKARLVLVGSGPVSGLKTPATFWKWSEDNEVDAVNAFDIGIMPLPDNEWTRGKCGYKLIQYMACAVPVIASRVGMNAEIVNHGECGFLATTTQEWSEALRQLGDDPTLREQMGRAGRAWVEKMYNTDVTAPKLAGLIKSCVAS